jgi:glycosyltransferase involved in cell wall biosynthesis
MRVLIVSQYFWPESFPINDVVKSLTEKGIEVDVLTGKPNYPDGKFFAGYRGLGCALEQRAGANVFRVPLAARGSRSARKLVFNYLSFVICACIFGPWLLRRRRYDAIFVYAISPLLQAIPALFLGFLKRAKVIVWVQDLWPESLVATGYVRNAFILKCVERVVKFIYRHSALLLVQSRAFEPQMKRLVARTPVVYFPNSVDPLFGAHTETDTALPDLPLSEDVFSVVFTGNVGAGQAVEVIVGAAALLRERTDISFVVVGKGSRWEWLAQEVSRLGLKNLHLPGRFPVETMPGIMHKASVLLVTLADEPIFAATVPSKVQAYMAAGRPILASINGEGARLVTEADAGLAVPAEDAGALANAVVQLFNMTPAERDRLGANGRRYSDTNFNQDKLMDQLITHFRTVSNIDRDE